MGRCLRSKRLRWALYEAAEGRCQMCGRDLPPDWHADHVTPWKVSRSTNVFDMQALCPACNLKKGSRMELQDKVRQARELIGRIGEFSRCLRRHQRLTLDLLGGIVNGVAGGDWPFLVSPGFLIEEVVPGGGKSFNAVMAASVLVGSGLFDAAVWISPRLTLIDQAMEDFRSTSVGMRFAGKPISIFNPANLVPHELPENPKTLFDPRKRVWVMPYQRLNGVAALLAQYAEKHRVLLILDEFQLLKDIGGGQDDDMVDPYGSWYRVLGPIINTCLSKTGFGGMILSGGLYRNDGKKLPNIRYRQGDESLGEDPKRMYAMSDVAYTLAMAQEDRCIIKLDMDFYDGEVSFRIDDNPSVIQGLGSLDEQLYNQKLTHFLEEPDVWQTIIRDMLESLDNYNPPGCGYHARYMVTSKSIEDATRHAEFLKAIGRNPLLIHSKLNAAEQKNLQVFRKGNGSWDGLVSVAMGYIGLSIPDLSHMAYLSHYRSAAWINQAFHRITRADNNPRAPAYQNQLARFFMPNDPLMRERAQELMDGQNPGVAALPPPAIPVPTAPGRGSQVPPAFHGLGASVSGREFNSNGVACDDHSFVDVAVRRFPQLNQIPRKVVEDFKQFTNEYGK